MAARPLAQVAPFVQTTAGAGDIAMVAVVAGVLVWRRHWWQSPVTAPALVVVDMQRYFCEPGSALARFVGMALPDAGSRYFELLDQVVVPNIAALIEVFRRRKLPIVFTEFGSHTCDGRDLPPWARRLNDAAVSVIGEPCFLALADPAARVIDELHPAAEEPVFGKATSGPLAGTRIDGHLAALHANPVVVSGVMTDMCVTGVTRELADSGFDIILASDACATFDQQSHEWSIQFLGSTFAVTAETETIIDQVVEGSAAQPPDVTASTAPRAGLRWPS